MRVVGRKLREDLTHTDATINGLVRDGVAIIGKHEVLYLHAQKAGIAFALLPTMEEIDKPCAILRSVVCLCHGPVLS